MEMPAVSPKSARSYDEVAEELALRGVSTGKMFGMPSLKAGGKLFAGVYGDALTFKLGGAAHAKRWPEFAEAACSYVAG